MRPPYVSDDVTSDDNAAGCRKLKYLTRCIYMYRASQHEYLPPMPFLYRKNYTNKTYSLMQHIYSLRRILDFVSCRWRAHAASATIWQVCEIIRRPSRLAWLGFPINNSYLDFQLHNRLRTLKDAELYLMSSPAPRAQPRYPTPLTPQTHAVLL